MFDRLEAIQRRAVRWILSEPYIDYDEIHSNSYRAKLKLLDLLPLEFKFVHTDMSMFFKIIHNFVNIKLPDYLRRVSPEDMTRLRTDHRDETQIICDIDEKLDVFKRSYFNRCYIYWNSLPLQLRQEVDYDKFQKKLKDYLWQLLLEDHFSDRSNSLSSFFSDSE